ncbi:high-affinity choline transporter 1 [Lingula anatina]|uniref:High-affinity choline transporter 1 n=1 Tax=Lingula anatina TaxID=7574 RepID=A0A1S3HGP4_LINAN|nr:high-affinity choline transporter 1 [Lingula anatina]XP_013384195.1 high-affinity choline transporter 1 [Lingula anatina]|eukprot:XP_013384194.1 high-affinity choline transporter 1 [Lingula anatina]
MVDGVINIWGLVAIIIFYIIIFIIGIVAGRKSKSFGKKAQTTELILAGRNIGPFVGIFTLTATWVGGGYINGTAEITLSSGLVWCQAPVGYSIALAIGGLVFAGPMRSAGYMTMLDPFQHKYGPVMAALLYIPALLGDLFWSAAILSALGSSLTVVIGLDNTLSIIVSAIIAVVYTLIGGLYSVAYTDVAQLIMILIGLFLAFPFAMHHPAVSSLEMTSSSWLGTLTKNDAGLYLDSGLQLIFGGIPWQVYFQRVLSAKTVNQAKWLSIVAGFLCVVCAVPAVMIGAIGASTNWTETAYVDVYNRTTVPSEEYKNILPLVLQYLTPPVVSFIGLGAVSAAVMSSTDSAILSMSSLFSHNVYRPLREFMCRGKKASELEVVWLMRVAVVVFGAAAAAMGIYITSIYDLFVLCSDFVYVILFPQLVCVIYLKQANMYGALTGYIIGWILRLGGGEATFNLAAFILYPWYDFENSAQRFPFKTFSMLVSFLSIVIVSLIFHVLFAREILPKKYDFFASCIPKQEEEHHEEEVENELGDPKENGLYNLGYIAEDQEKQEYNTKL